MPVGAIAATYQYFGPAFRAFSDSDAIPGAYSTSSRMVATIETSDALPTDMPYNDSRALLTSYRFHDGRYVFTEENSFIDHFSLETVAGSITNWRISILSNDFPNVPLGPGEQFSRMITRTTADGLSLANFVQGSTWLCTDAAGCQAFGQRDSNGAPSLDYESAIAGRVGRSGAWSRQDVPPAPVPLPASVMLLSFAFLSLRWFGRMTR